MNKHRKAEETQRILASIVQNSTDAIDSTSLGGTIVSWNPAAERLYGYSEEEITGKHVSILTPPDHLEEMKEMFLKVARGRSSPGMRPSASPRTAGASPSL